LQRRLVEALTVFVRKVVLHAVLWAVLCWEQRETFLEGVLYNMVFAGLVLVRLSYSISCVWS